MNSSDFTKSLLARVSQSLDTDADDPGLRDDLTALITTFEKAKGISDLTGEHEDVTLLKVDEDQHMVWGWALVSVEKGQEVIDLQGDLCSTDELQKAVHESFMKHRTGKRMHSQGRVVGEVVDSVVFTKALQDALGIDLGREGWFVGMKITKEDVWQEIKAGRLGAFSIGGEGERHPIAKNKDAKGHGSNPHGAGALASEHAKLATSNFQHAEATKGKSHAVYLASAQAHQGSTIAHMSGESNLHNAARDLHYKAAQVHRAATNIGQAEHHMAVAREHHRLGAIVGKSAEPVMFDDLIKMKDAQGHGSNPHGAGVYVNPKPGFKGMEAPHTGVARQAQESATHAHQLSAQAKKLNTSTAHFDARDAHEHAAHDFSMVRGGREQYKAHMALSAGHLNQANTLRHSEVQAYVANGYKVGKKAPDIHAAKYMRGLLDTTTQRAEGVSQRFMQAQAAGQVPDEKAHKKHVVPALDHIRDAHVAARQGDHKKAQSHLDQARGVLDGAEHELQFTYGEEDGGKVKKVLMFDDIIEKTKDALGHGSNAHGFTQQAGKNPGEDVSRTGGPHDKAFLAHNKAYQSLNQTYTPVKARTPLSPADKATAAAHNNSAKAHLMTMMGGNSAGHLDIAARHTKAAKSWAKLGQSETANAHTAIAAHHVGESARLKSLGF